MTIRYDYQTARKANLNNMGKSDTIIITKPSENTECIVYGRYHIAIVETHLYRKGLFALFSNPDSLVPNTLFTCEGALDRKTWLNQYVSSFVIPVGNKFISTE